MDNTREITGIINIIGEMKKDKCEDASGFKLAKDFCCMGVFDGCGGIGSEIYGGGFENNTGAYIAARLTRKAVFDWFRKEFLAGDRSISDRSIPKNCNGIRKIIQDRLHFANEISQEFKEENMLKGSMKKVFPTTASVILLSKSKSYLEMNFFWAGDSRGYILTPRGLMQITEDDTERRLDALDSIENDQPLSNVISADTEFRLNACYMTADYPAIAIVASDGAYNYFRTPMHFENVILQTLCSSNSFFEWKDAMQSEIKKVAADDYSIIIAAVGYDNFAQIKDSLAERAHNVAKYYVKPIDDASEEEGPIIARELWGKSYIKSYYREEA